MAIKKVILFGDSFLRKKSHPISDFNSDEVAIIKTDLKDTLDHLQAIHKKGGGLAAPQIGYSYQVIYINARDRSFFLFNPKIIDKSKKLFDVWDFCFSGAAAFEAKIKRHWHITVEYDDENREKQKEVFEEYFSELVQHEVDHLEGRLFIDLIEDPSNIRMVVKEAKPPTTPLQ